VDVDRVGEPAFFKLPDTLKGKCIVGGVSNGVCKNTVPLRLVARLVGLLELRVKVAIRECGSQS
jgi:hypothetical protein